MAEYIERDAVLEKCREIAACEWNHRASPVSWADAYEQFAEDVEALPSVDVAPVRHGRWECGKPCPVCGRDRFEGLDADIWADWEPPYCPNCGAKMDLEV